MASRVKPTETKRLRGGQLSITDPLKPHTCPGGWAREGERVQIAHQCRRLSRVVLRGYVWENFRDVPGYTLLSSQSN